MKRFVLLLFLCFAVVANAQIIERTVVDKKFKVGDAAPKFHQVVSNTKGKVILLQFWSPELETCRDDIAKIREVYQKRREQGFRAIGVSFASQEVLKTLQYSYPMPWMQLSGWTTVPPNQPINHITIWEVYGVASVPKMLLIDGDSHKILATTEELRADLDGVVSRELAKRPIAIVENRRG